MLLARFAWFSSRFHSQALIPGLISACPRAPGPVEVHARSRVQRSPPNLTGFFMNTERVTKKKRRTKVQGKQEPPAWICAPGGPSPVPSQRTRGPKGNCHHRAACRWANNQNSDSCFFWTLAPCLRCQHALLQASSELGRHTFLSRAGKKHEAVALPARPGEGKHTRAKALPAAIVCSSTSVPKCCSSRSLHGHKGASAHPRVVQIIFPKAAPPETSSVL